jgi:altronate hydrolase
MNIVTPIPATTTSRPAPRVMRLHDADNVIVAVDGLSESADALGVRAAARIPRGHKLAARAIAAGEAVLKFGQVIGYASRAIGAGEHVHEHNCAFQPVAGAYDFATDAAAPTLVPEPRRASFMGYRRASGRSGTRNYIGVLTSVNCSATVARFMAQEIERSGILADYPGIDGVIPLVHGGGCALDTDGEGYEVLKRTQWGYAANPNIGGVVMVGLGCEGFQIGRWMEAYGISESETFRKLTIQEVGGTRKTVAAGVEAIKAMLPSVGAARREPVPASELVLALQCGGSDGYSGITANPALGAAVDLLVAQGGTAILSETPEIYGAEHLLTRRAVSRAVGEDLVAVIRWWEDYVARNRMSLNNNPSPGNKAGGLTTILEKSLGAVAKAGSTPLTGVYRYAEPVTARGLVFMDTPGYDPVAATGQVAGGANLIAFTTGRGSAYGCKPTPSIKLATNTAVFEHMRDDMDVNCGDVLDGVTLAEKGREIFDTLLRVASGERTRSEELGYGDAEFVPWTIGATM